MPLLTYLVCVIVDCIRNIRNLFALFGLFLLFGVSFGYVTFDLYVCLYDGQVIGYLKFDLLLW